MFHVKHFERRIIYEVLQAITTVGFPIAMCLIMAWYIREIEIRHSNEVNALKDALNNNTLALQHLADITEKGENENDN